VIKSHSRRFTGLCALLFAAISLLSPFASAHDDHSPLMKIIKVKLDIEKLQEAPATKESLNKQLGLLTRNLHLLAVMQKKVPNYYRNTKAYQQSLDERLALLQEHTDLLQQILKQIKTLVPDQK
jgi:small-conductance mechanosensitive channel